MNARADSFAMAMAAAAPAERASQGGARRAALLLHTVCADDRAWLLAQLPAEERRVMEPLLAELRELNIPADRDLLAEVADAEGGALPPPNAGTLASADPALVAKVLAGEPLALVARVFALGPWSWSGAVLATLSPMRREQLRDRLAAAQRPDASQPRSLLDSRLIELIEARVLEAARDAKALPRRASSRTAPGSAIVPAWMRRWLARDAAPLPAGALE